MWWPPNECGTSTRNPLEVFMAHSCLPIRQGAPKVQPIFKKGNSSFRTAAAKGVSKDLLKPSLRHNVLKALRMANYWEKSLLRCQFPRQGTSANSLHSRHPDRVAGLFLRAVCGAPARSGGDRGNNTLARLDEIASIGLLLSVRCYLLALRNRLRPLKT